MLHSALTLNWPVIVTWSPTNDEEDAVITGYGIFIDDALVKKVPKNCFEVWKFCYRDVIERRFSGPIGC